jgi:RHS repeat-associated protein
LLSEVESSKTGAAAKYTWSAAGQKLSGTVSGAYGLHYLGSLVYWFMGDVVVLGDAAFSAGRIVAYGSGSSTRHVPNYSITDHLGSTRAIVQLSDGEVNLLGRNDYYPFGQRVDSPQSPVNNNRYTFSGKEEQEMFGLELLDFGFRMYDPFIGRWTTPDPLAEKYYSYSPYNYCLNNPARFIDPWGLAVEPPRMFSRRIPGGTLKYWYDDDGNTNGWYEIDEIDIGGTDWGYSNSDLAELTGGLGGLPFADGPYRVAYRGLNIDLRSLSLPLRPSEKPKTPELNKLYLENPMALVIHNAHKNFWRGTAELAVTELTTVGDSMSAMGAVIASTGLGAGVGTGLMGIGSIISRTGIGIGMLLDFHDGNYAGLVVGGISFGLNIGMGPLGKMGGSAAINGGVNLFFTPAQYGLGYAAGTTRK